MLKDVNKLKQTKGTVTYKIDGMLELFKIGLKTKSFQEEHDFDRVTKGSELVMYLHKKINLKQETEVDLLGNIYGTINSNEAINRYLFEDMNNLAKNMAEYATICGFYHNHPPFRAHPKYHDLYGPSSTDINSTMGDAPTIKSYLSIVIDTKNIYFYYVRHGGNDIEKNIKPSIPTNGNHPSRTEGSYLFSIKRTEVPNRKQPKKFKRSNFE